MSQDEIGSADDVISAKDMRAALDKEVRTVMKAAELRIREFTQFTQAYTAGEITPADATEKYMHHMDKWGDALPGVARAAQNLTDEEITADMERAMRPNSSHLQTHKRRQQSAGSRATEKD